MKKLMKKHMSIVPTSCREALEGAWDLSTFLVEDQKWRAEDHGTKSYSHVSLSSFSNENMEWFYLDGLFESMILECFF